MSDNLNGLNLREKVAYLAYNSLLQLQATGKKGFGADVIQEKAKELFPGIEIKKGSFSGYLSLLVQQPGSGLKYGGRAQGYFIDEAISNSGSETTEEELYQIHFDLDWEKQAAQRLAEILQHKSLDRIMKQSTKLQLRARKRRLANRDVQPTKLEMVSALIKIYGSDLMTDKEIGPTLRGLLAKELRIYEPGRFHPGATSAINFVTDCGLPIQLASERSERSREDFIEVDGIPTLNPLEDYQNFCQSEVLKILCEEDAEKSASLVCLPTGAGKTRVAVESIHSWVLHEHTVNYCPSNANLTVWIAQTDELCEQAVESFLQVWAAKQKFSPLRVVRFWSTFSKSEDTKSNIFETIKGEVVPTVLITTYQRLLNELQSGFGGLDLNLQVFANNLDLIVIDEAHHSAAPSYQQIVSTLRLARNAPRPLKLLGLTATPFRFTVDPRAGVDQLREVFQTRVIIPDVSRSESLPERYRALKASLQSRGILALENYEELETKLHVKLPSGNGDFDQKVSEGLSVSNVVHQRHGIILKRIKEVLEQEPNASILYFGHSVEDAFEMNVELMLDDVRSGFISGNTSAAQRRRLIEDFKTGRIQVLCNCEVLTTGFDAPRTSHIIVARPTNSPVLYTQMIGRGLRGERFGGTKICQVINVRDNIDGNERLAYEDYLEYWNMKGAKRSA